MSIMTVLLGNFISFYHQAYSAGVWSARHNILHPRASTSMTLHHVQVDQYVQAGVERALDAGRLMGSKRIKRDRCAHHYR